jgi:hypothetical protein
LLIKKQDQKEAGEMMSAGSGWTVKLFLAGYQDVPWKPMSPSSRLTANHRQVCPSGIAFDFTTNRSCLSSFSCHI